MRTIVTRKSILSVLIALTLVVTFAGGALIQGRATKAYAASPKSYTNNNPICSRLGKSLQGSTGMQMWCFGPQQNGSGQHPVSTSTGSFGSNVNAANPKEDRSPAGVQADGQSEVSIASIGQYSVEAWNDSTGFIAPCPSPMNKEELTGYGFSSDGGKTYTDEGGLPNTNCSTTRLSGDPSVEAWHAGGSNYFYVSSIDVSSFSSSDPRNFLAINACKVSGAGLSCSQPIIAASSTQCDPSATFCSFLDKEFLSIDPVHGRLYMSYTEFGINFSPPDNLTNGQIELAVCDIGKPNGTPGPQGGTAANPVCFPGSAGTATRPGSPYFVVAPGDLSCENEGAYPAVDRATGAVYVAYEHNWATNIFGSFGGPTNCLAVPTQNVTNYIPATCLTLPNASCTGPATTNAVNIISMDATFIPGYNRFPMNDFPRIAVSDSAGTVSIVWNDARRRPSGDIYLQSYSLGGLAPVTARPVRIDTAGGWAFLPAVRQADAHGNLNISFYGRTSKNTAITDVFASESVNPRAVSTPASNTLVTTKPSDWNAVSSLIIPNFGDYTDNYVQATSSAPFNSDLLYVAWSDGRIGVPQPFSAHTHVP